MSLKKSLLAASISCMLLHGCGGGGNDDSGSTATSPSTVSGNAVKGIIQNGNVRAYQLDSTGNKAGDAVGMATTAEDGTYSLSIIGEYDNESALLLELTADSSTTMICDALNGCGASVNRGDSFTPPANFKLSTIIPGAAANSTVTAPITAFTHMAAKKIQADSDASTTNISAVTSTVNQLVGVNILNTQPVNITNAGEFGGADINQKRYTIMLAALAAEMAKDDNGDNNVDSSDFAANLEDIAGDFATDGDFGDADGLSVNNFLAAVDAEANHAANNLDDDLKTSLSQHTDIVAAQSTSGEFSPAATTGEGSDDVALAKAMVAEVRTWGNAMAALESPADAFMDDADTIVESLDSNSQAVIEVFAMAVNSVVAAIDASTGNVPSSVMVYDDNGQVVGEVTVTNNSDSTSQQYTMSAANLSNVAVNGTIQINAALGENLQTAGQAAEYAQTADLTATLNGSAASAESRVTLADTSFTLRLKADADSGDSTENSEGNFEPEIAKMAFSGGLTVEELNSGSSTGKKMGANAEISLVSLADGLNSINDSGNLTLEKISLTDLTIGDDSDSSAGLSITFEVDDATRFDTLSYLNYQPVQNDRIEPDYNDIDLSAAKTYFSAASINQIRYYASSNQTCLSGYRNTAANPYFNKCEPGDPGNLVSQISPLITERYNQPYVTSATVDQVFVDSFGDGYAYANIRLEVSDMETAESFLDATLTITGKIDLAEHPEAMLTLTADKTGLRAGSFTAKLGYDNKSMEFMANTTNGQENGTSGDLTFTNADGVVMKVTASSGNATSGSVMVGDTLVGTMEELSNDAMIIRYNDGTFESL